MKKVLVWGTFDIIHLGHLNFLKQARSKGDYLIVLLSRNQTVSKIKGTKPLHHQQERLKMIQSLKPVDEAHIETGDGQFRWLKKIRPEIICLGYDQTAYLKKLAAALNKIKLKPKIFRLQAYQPQKYKSSIIKKKLRQ